MVIRKVEPMGWSAHDLLPSEVIFSPSSPLLRLYSPSSFSSNAETETYAEAPKDRTSCRKWYVGKRNESLNIFIQKTMQSHWDSTILLLRGFLFVLN